MDFRNYKMCPSRTVGRLAVAAVALLLWVGSAAAQADAGAARELVSRYLTAVYAQDWQVMEPGQETELPLVFRADYDTPREHGEFHVTYQFFPRDKFPGENGAAARAQVQAQGTLEVRVKDHRDAIDDFRGVDLLLGKLRLAPNARLRSSDPGWLELTPQLDRMDLTRYKDGKAAATVYRGALAPGRFAAVDLQVAEIRGILVKSGAPGQVKNVVKPIRLAFEVKPGAITVVVLDLELLDLSDHPGRGYELFIKGYELYEDGRLLRKIPPA